MHDPDTALGVVFTEFGSSDKDPLPAGMAALAGEVAKDTNKPVVAASFSNRQFYSRTILELNAAGIPMLDSGDQALRAIKHAFAYRDARNRKPITTSPRALDTTALERWRTRLDDSSPLNEIESLTLLKDFGVPVIDTLFADSTASTIEAAQTLGFPVALKTASTKVTHKSDQQGVLLNIANETSLLSAYADLQTRHGCTVSVSSMAPAGVDMALGIVNDPQFGPLLMVGAGGTLVELLDDVLFVIPPVTHEEIAQLLSSLRINKLLTGYRGKPAADVDAFCEATVQLSVLALSLSGVIENIDINPVIVSPQGCVAVDALIQHRTLRNIKP